MSSSNSPSEQFDDSDRDPHFSPDGPGPSVRCFAVFNSSAEISSLVQSDSESDDGEQKQTVAKNKLSRNEEEMKVSGIEILLRKGRLKENLTSALKTKINV